MNQIIEKFNKVMEAYNEDYTNAKTDKEREEVQKKYDKEIDKAEATLESELEAEIQADNDKLLAEQKASEKESLEAEEDTPVKEESELLKKFKDAIDLGPKVINTKFKEKELIALGKEFGKEWNYKGTKIDKVKELIALIKNDIKTK